VLGTLLVAVCTFGIASWALSVGHRTQVLVVVKAVPAGTMLTASDLAPVGVSADPQVSAVPASAEGQEIGKVANVALVPGSLLESSELGTGPTISPGTAVVGLDLKGGAFPSELSVGSTVEVIQTPSGNGVSTGGVVLAQNATVLSTASDPAGSGTLVAITVPSAEAAGIAAAGAAGDVSLAMLAGAGD
jgi:hypothetical protein